MRGKKIILIGVIVFSMAALFTVDSHAEYDWHSCIVVKAGVSGENMCFYLKDASSGQTWWAVVPNDSENKNRMLVIALTALSNSLKVHVWFDGAEEKPELKSLYITHYDIN